MPGGPGQGVLVGRRDELAVLDEQVGERAGVAVVVGPMGVGKSHLLAAWTSRWQAHGGDVVVVRATRSTATIPFGAFADWVPTRPRGTVDRLAVLQTTATSLAGPAGRSSPGAGGPDRRPVVAVDDGHLLDPGSAALVLHLVEHVGVGVVVTARSDATCPDAVAALWKEGLATRLELDPLTGPQTAELVEQVLLGPVAPAMQERIWRLTQGNPLYVREVVEAARAQGGLVRSAGGWRWQGGLRRRARLAELVSDRICGSASAARRVLDLVALGEPAPVDLLAHLAPADVLADVERHGLVVVDPPARGRPEATARLVHPLYAEVLRAELPAVAVRDLSAELAEAAVATGMDRRDPMRVATWLLDGATDPTGPADPTGPTDPTDPTGPARRTDPTDRTRSTEPPRAELLLRAASQARYLDDYRRSLRFAEAAERAGGGWQAAFHRAVALGPLGRVDEADELLASLTRPGAEPEAHAAAARTRAEQSFWYRGAPLPAARAILAEAAQAVPPPSRSALRSHEAQLAVHALDLHDVVRLAGEAYSDAASVLDRLHALTTAGFAAAALGRTHAALAAVKLTTASALQVADEDPGPALHGALAYLFASLSAGRVDQAARVFQNLLDLGERTRPGPPQAFLALCCARAALTQGRVRTAAELSRQALAQLGDENHYDRGTWAAYSLATAAAQAGDVESAQGALAWIGARQRRSLKADEIFVALARAWLAAARGELPAAQDAALSAARQARATPAGAIEATVLLDAARLGAAPVVAGRLAELAETVEGPYVATVAGFAAAAADGDGPGLEGAAEQFAAMGARLCAAEAAVLAADAHGAAGRTRRRAESLALAQRCAAGCEGAVTPLLGRLDQAPLVSTLTAREHQVAELAARGHVSREIGAMLGIAVRTVHSHLHHAYTKLGTSDRQELADVLRIDGRQPEPPTARHDP